MILTNVLWFVTILCKTYTIDLEKKDDSQILIYTEHFIVIFFRTEIEKYDKIVPIGFDLEWPFSFQTGSGKTALAQICFSENICYLLHIYSLKKLPAAFVVLLSHPKVRLVGVNIKKWVNW